MSNERTSQRELFSAYSATRMPEEALRAYCLRKGARPPDWRIRISPESIRITVPTTKTKRRLGWTAIAAGAVKGLLRPFRSRSVVLTLYPGRLTLRAEGVAVDEPWGAVSSIAWHLVGEDLPWSKRRSAFIFHLPGKSATFNLDLMPDVGLELAYVVNELRVIMADRDRSEDT
jgi:hypothetical protein